MSPPNNLRNSYTIRGYRFVWEGQVYECRGDIVYDDYGDKWPEDALIEAGRYLAEDFVDLGFRDAYSDFGEKGWVYVFPNGNR